jgi:chromate reductase
MTQDMSSPAQTVPVQVGIIVGSNRQESVNRKLASALARLAGNRVQTLFIGIDDLPMYNGDLDPTAIPSVVRFKNEVAHCDGVLFVMPEHNRSLTAVLKNAIDWGSKPFEANVWREKPAAITGTSPGAIGTAVGQQHLRQILGILGSLVLGGEAYIQFKAGLVDEEGNVTDETTVAFLQTYLSRFIGLVNMVAAEKKRIA